MELDCSKSDLVKLKETACLCTLTNTLLLELRI